MKKNTEILTVLWHMEVELHSFWNCPILNWIQLAMFILTAKIFEICNVVSSEESRLPCCVHTVCFLRSGYACHVLFTLYASCGLVMLATFCSHCVLPADWLCLPRSVYTVCFLRTGYACHVLFTLCASCGLVMLLPSAFLRKPVALWCGTKCADLLPERTPFSK
jgi:hypothetical protein